MKNVFVGMSGGVDSSVTAALLKQAGYDVTGVYMKNWTRDIGGVECPWRKDLADARSVAALLDIPFEVFDFETEYRELVVQYMIDEYRAGRTPNPDIACNQEVKFKLFLDAALARGADMIATGHYARTEKGRLFTAADEGKDQTYFLYRVESEALSKSLFPLGDYQKSEIRSLAKEFGLPTADKPDSQGICFVGEVDIKDFLSEYIETKPGPIKHVDGRILGEHEGAEYYTIGQRHGLGVGGALRDDSGSGLPLYVVSKDMSENTIFVSEDLAALMNDEVSIDQLHWINEAPEIGEEFLVRSRHRGRLTPAVVTSSSGDTMRLKLEQPERALTAGQSLVLYQKESETTEVVGGGIITQ